MELTLTLTQRDVRGQVNQDLEAAPGRAKRGSRNSALPSAQLGELASQTAPRPDRAPHSQPEGERGPPAQEKTTDAENEKNVKPSVE